MFRLVALEKSALKTCLDRAHVRNLKNMKLFMLLSLWVAFCPPNPGTRKSGWPGRAGQIHETPCVLTHKVSESHLPPNTKHPPILTQTQYGLKG